MRVGQGCRRGRRGLIGGSLLTHPDLGQVAIHQSRCEELADRHGQRGSSGEQLAFRVFGGVDHAIRARTTRRVNRPFEVQATGLVP